MTREELLAMAGECASNVPGCGCPTPPVLDQLQFTQARFNDTSAQTAATMQQQAAQQAATWGAHLLRLQHDICRMDHPNVPTGGTG